MIPVANNFSSNAKSFDLRGLAPATTTTVEITAESSQEVVSQIKVSVRRKSRKRPPDPYLSTLLG